MLLFSHDSEQDFEFLGLGGACAGRADFSVVPGTVPGEFWWSLQLVALSVP